jgi:hypothetical protein
MMSQSDAVIYLASQRGCTQSTTYRSYHTFNFGTYFNEHRKPFGNLTGFNDDVLAVGKSVTLTAPKDALVFIIPIAGQLRYRLSENEPREVSVGKIHALRIIAGTQLEIENTDNELINFIHVWFNDADSRSNELLIEFKFLLNENKLIPFLLNSHQSAVRMSVGRFAGRAESIYKVSVPSKGAFVFVLEGAFEVNNRLLQARDGLAIWNTDEVEFEALSNDAILFIVES